MKNVKEYLRTSRYLHIFYLAAGILLVYKLLFDFHSVLAWRSQVMRVMSPFLAGFIIAYCLHIPCGWLENKMKQTQIKWIMRAAKPVSILFVYIILILLIMFALGTLIPMVSENVAQFFTLLPTYFEQLVAFSEEMPSFGALELDVWVRSVVEAKPWNQWLSRFDTDSLLSSVQYVTGFFSGLIAVILTIISSVYFLSEYDRMKDFLKRLIRLMKHEEKQRAALKYARLIDGSFRKFLICQLLDSLILGVITTIEFLILRSPYPFALGMMLAVANIVPYFGSIIASIVAVVIMGFTNGIEAALLTGVILLITQQTDGNVIQPKLMGASFSISPILIIIGIAIGGSLGGIVGMIFAIPVVNVVKTILEEYMQTKEKARADLQPPPASGLG